MKKSMFGILRNKLQLKIKISSCKLPDKFGHHFKKTCLKGARVFSSIQNERHVVCPASAQVPVQPGPVATAFSALELVDAGLRTAEVVPRHPGVLCCRSILPFFPVDATKSTRDKGTGPCLHDGHSVQGRVGDFASWWLEKNSISKCCNLQLKHDKI